MFFCKQPSVRTQSDNQQLPVAAVFMEWLELQIIARKEQYHIWVPTGRFSVNKRRSYSSSSSSSIFFFRINEF